MTNNEEIVQGIKRVHDINVSRIVRDPTGNNPVCKNRIGTWICERCGNNVKHMRGKACPASKPQDRWSILYD